jgi:CheY-like chemotaxis protein
VPEALLAERHVLPLDEDGRTVRVATADPVDLLTEAEIRRVSGRTPAFVVVPPARLRAALDETLGRARKGRRAEVPSEPFGPPSPPECPILIVDDDPTARLVARAVLERKGYPVLEAPGGAEALALFGLNPGIGLAVVDLEMPLMDGHELVRRLRAAPGGAALAIVVLTGTQDPSVEAALIEEGADDYLEKPLDPRLFLARVSATLRRTAAGSG